MRYTKKQMIAMLLVGAVFLYPLLRFYFRLAIPICIGITIASEVLCVVSFFFEKRSVQKYQQLKDAVQSGEYRQSAEWQEHYLEFVSTKGFEPVKHASMKADLRIRYFRPYGVFLVGLGVALLILNVVMVDELDLMLFLLAVSAGFVIYGCFRFSAPNVRRFLKQCGDAYAEINASFMEGKQLTYRKAFSSLADISYNDGINLGSAYVVLFQPKEIVAVRYSDIVTTKHRILCTKFYGNGAYTGTAYTHHLDVTIRDAQSGANRTISVQLREFQAVYACETLQAQISTPALQQRVENVQV